MVLTNKDEVGIFEEAVEEDQKLPEAGCESDHGWLAAGEELLVMGLEDAVMANGAEGGHEEGAADGAPAAGDVAGALEEAAVAVVRGHADEGDDGLVTELAQLWQLGHESGSDDWTDAGHGAQSTDLGIECGILGDEPGRFGPAGLDLEAKQAGELGRLAAE